ncbi:hypothetical protein EXIGLDRAFT_760488 [Exidia glandulosa HHB12029]|uniref:F-box domain-containing protein n=1 Tax=Exidia glandulosa HHB12029 TaxID=1314781 RepID=A0A165PAI8_EXIGL|nr:hypothetical protein EXIGLDRAFT_760488 [Exidia glandulosa HHB12029]
MSVVDPNRYAGPQERAVLLDSIRYDEQVLLAAQRRLDRANTALHNARIARIAAQEVEFAAMMAHQGVAEDVARLHERLRLARAFYHPIRKLSADLLHAIFLVLYGDCQRDLLTAERRDVFTLASVCRRWRTIALEFAAIWRTVTLGLSEDKRLVLEEPFVTACIARAKQAIDVVLVLCDTSQPVRCIDSDYLTCVKYVACTSRRFICWFSDIVYLPLLNLSSLHPSPKLEEIGIEHYGRTPKLWPKISLWLNYISDSRACGN